jgi:PmbA protein
MDSALLHQLVDEALKAGADAAEAVGSQSASLSVEVRLGQVEEVERSESRDLGLRVFIGQSQAVVSGSGASPAALRKLVERAVAMARLAPADPYVGLAPSELLAKRPYPELDLYDPAEPSAEQLEAAARRAEDAARAVAGVTNSDGGSAGWSKGEWRFVTSNGFEGEHRSSGFSLGASAIAGEGAGMERGGEGRSTRHLSDLPDPESIGAEAGRRAVQRLGARRLASQTAPVIIENRAAMSLISPLIGAIAGPSVARGVSFLKDRLGQPLFAKGVNLTDDPFRVRGLGSTPFDDEGVAVQKRAIIADGVLTTWLLNLSSARQLGMTSTGHAHRALAGAPSVSTHNLTLEPGTASQAELLRDAGAGLLVTSLFGPSLNSNTGDWSAGVSGFWFEGGELAYPVNEITIAGNLIDLWGRLFPGADLELRGASNAPSLLIDAVAIGGQ